MRRLLLLVFCVPLLLSAEERQKGTGGIVFTPFQNESGDADLDYLGMLLPNAFSSSFRKSGHDTVSAVEVASVMKDEKPEWPYPADKMHELCDRFGTDYAISGSFNVRGESVTLIISIYSSHYGEYVTFPIEGTIESKMFTLVDRLNRIIEGLARNDYRYKISPLRKNARSVIFSDLTGPGLNDFLMGILRSGMRVASTRESEILPYSPHREAAFFRSLSTRKGGIFRRVEPAEFNLIHEPWKSIRLLSSEHQNVRTGHLYYSSSHLVTEQFLDKAQQSLGAVDYLLFVSLDASRERFWLRCIDTDRRELIWLQSGRIDDGSGSAETRLAEQLLKLFPEAD